MLFVVDRAVKHWLVLTGGQERQGLIALAKNQGVAFGLALQGLIFYVLLFVILIILVWLALRYFRERKTILHLAVVLIIIGALSNMIDRLTFGAVIDYVDLKFWPIFNLADVMVVAGAGVWILNSWGRKG